MPLTRRAGTPHNQGLSAKLSQNNDSAVSFGSNDSTGPTPTVIFRPERDTRTSRSRSQASRGSSLFDPDAGRQGPPETRTRRSDDVERGRPKTRSPWPKPPPPASREGVRSHTSVALPRGANPGTTFDGIARSANAATTDNKKKPGRHRLRRIFSSNSKTSTDDAGNSTSKKPKLSRHWPRKSSIAHKDGGGDGDETNDNQPPDAAEEWEDQDYGNDGIDDEEEDTASVHQTTSGDSNHFTMFRLLGKLKRHKNKSLPTHESQQDENATHMSGALPTDGPLDETEPTVANKRSFWRLPGRTKKEECGTEASTWRSRRCTSRTVAASKKLSKARSLTDDSPRRPGRTQTTTRQRSTSFRRRRPMKGTRSRPKGQIPGSPKSSKWWRMGNRRLEQSSSSGEERAQTYFDAKGKLRLTSEAHDAAVKLALTKWGHLGQTMPSTTGSQSDTPPLPAFNTKGVAGDVRPRLEARNLAAEPPHDRPTLFERRSGTLFRGPPSDTIDLTSRPNYAPPPPSQVESTWTIPTRGGCQGPRQLTATELTSAWFHEAMLAQHRPTTVPPSSTARDLADGSVATAHSTSVTSGSTTDSTDRPRQGARAHRMRRTLRGRPMEQGTLRGFQGMKSNNGKRTYTWK